MKTKLTLWTAVLLGFCLSVQVQADSSSGPDSDVAPTRISALERPRIALSIFGGAERSQFSASKDMNLFFNSPSQGKQLLAPNIGADLEFLLGRIISFGIGLDFNQRGQYVKRTTVRFNSSPFPHDFESKATLRYCAVPLFVKARLEFGPQWLGLRAALVPALLVNDDVTWTVDGQEITPGTSVMPSLYINATDIRLRPSFEYGLRFGNNAVFCRAQYDYGIYSVATNLNGNIFTRAYGGVVGFTRFITIGN